MKSTYLGRSSRSLPAARRHAVLEAPLPRHSRIEVLDNGRSFLLPPASGRLQIACIGQEVSRELELGLDCITAEGKGCCGQSDVASPSEARSGAGSEARGGGTVIWACL